jgi:hypothetical protein
MYSWWTLHVATLFSLSCVIVLLNYPCRSWAFTGYWKIVQLRIKLLEPRAVVELPPAKIVAVGLLQAIRITVAVSSRVEYWNCRRNIASYTKNINVKFWVLMACFINTSGKQAGFEYFICFCSSYFTTSWSLDDAASTDEFEEFQLEILRCACWVECSSYGPV